VTRGPEPIGYVVQYRRDRLWGRSCTSGSGHWVSGTRNMFDQPCAGSAGKPQTWKTERGAADKAILYFESEEVPIHPTDHQICQGTEHAWRDVAWFLSRSAEGARLLDTVVAEIV
jgi:hypothetical protein